MNWEELSIIIPVGPDEHEHVYLLKDLTPLFGKSEIICVFAKGSEKTVDNVKCISASQGRANQLNEGAKAANRKYLWFIHADSRIMKESFLGLKKAIYNAPDKLSYFNLKYTVEEGRQFRINEWGIRLRSRIFGVPFGDQGFLINKDIFFDSGGYPVTVDYGEDHIFIWKLRQRGIKLNCISNYLESSPRKYREYGRIKLMIKYQKMWIKQAMPEVIIFLKSRGVL
ncbi:MAG: hypothetical protein HQ509_08660 [Candidatus Marinimicrobia bacterium]|nr:hypothetical protein [Candidatus Neomarinimicrobiota bacterium]